MNTVFEVMINFYQGFLLIFFPYLRLPALGKQQWWIDVLFVLLTGSALCFLQYSGLHIPDGVIFLLPFIYTIVTRRGTWIQRIMWLLALGIAFDAIVMVVANLYTTIFDVQLETLMATGHLRIGYVLVTNMAITAILAVLAYIKRDNDGFHLGRFPLLVFVISLLIEFAIAEMQFYLQAVTQIEDKVFFCVNLSVFALMLMTLLLYEMLTQSAKTRYLTEMRLQTLTLDQNYQKEMTAVYDEMLTVQHDLRKQVNTIRQLLEVSSNVDRETAMSLLNVEIPTPYQFITGCTTVDAILTAKHTLMERQQITFMFKPYPLQELPVDSGTFCILLTNILDNAMEAVARIVNPSTPHEICLEFSRTWDMFYVRCTNTMNPQTIHRIGDRFLSSKDNQRFHGFGTESIRRIADENGGVCSFEINGDRFIVDVMLVTDEKDNTRVV